jgi:hypothetical protein
MVARPLPIAAIKDTPDFPVENQWVLLPDGEWYLVIPWKEGENPLLQLFKGAAESKGPATAVAEPPKEVKPALAGSDIRLMPDESNPQTVHRGEKVLFRYHYKNTGTVPIKIFSAHGDCHCTSVQQEHPTLAPGESGTLEVTVDSFGLPFGRVEKPVTVTFSDTDKAETFSVRFINAPNFMVVPPDVDFGSIRKGAPVEKKVRIENQSGRKVKFINIYKSDPRLTLSLDKTEAEPGESVVLTVRCSPLEPGEVMDKPFIRTDLPGEEMLTISIQGKILP